MVYTDGVDATMDEMSIVDVFTKLIFDAQSPLDLREEMVIIVLGDLVPSLADASRRDLSEHLRSMSVDEMIRVVDRVKQQLSRQQKPAAVERQCQVHYLTR